MDHPGLLHKYAIVHYTRGNGVEVGAGADLGPDGQVRGVLYQHFKPASDPASIPDASLDFVFAVDTDVMPWLDKIKPGGHLVAIAGERLTLESVDADGNLWPVDESWPAEKTACVVRYGGFGDQLQAANLLPELKRQGYYVVFMTLPRGQEILKHDPHIDAWLIQDNDQVPNGELHLFWEVQAKRFTKFVQLSESVEGTLLAYPGRANHMWPDSVRRARMGRNYLEWTAELAELPYLSESRFYPSDDESLAADRYLLELRRSLVPPKPFAVTPARFSIMWCLSGSSFHKSYPHADSVIARILLEMPEAVVVFTGDEACQVLEAGWEDEQRVRRESGKMGIRATLALAQQVDCVVGPETGVLNAVAFEPMGKVIMLSHSSRENLTKHWVNCETLQPKTSCHPCHRLHYGREFCRTEETTHAAQCAWDISGYETFEAIAKHYRAWKLLRSVMAANEPALV